MPSSKPRTKMPAKAVALQRATPLVCPVDKTRHLQMVAVPGKTEDRMYADLVADGVVSNASTAIRFNRVEQNDVSLTELVASLQDQGYAVNRGDLSAAERMLNAQAVAMNAIFMEMSRRAALNMGDHLGATETYLRLGLKAQAQCRATVETLAEMKNPRQVAFVRQANIAHGAQQVNNAETGTNNSARMARPLSARARKSGNPPIKLLEQQHGEWMDPGATRKASGVDPDVETVGAINGAKKRGG